MTPYTSVRSFVAILIFALAGCVSTPIMHDVETQSIGQATIFGKVEVFYDGNKQNWGGMWSGRGMSLLLRDFRSSEITRALVVDPGDFYWKLTPGNYTIVGYDIWEGGVIAGRIWLQFTVPPGAKSIYIGDLILNFSRGRSAVDLKDNYAAAVDALRRKFPGMQVAPVSAVPQLEKPPGTYTQITDICGTEWGIGCSSSNAGVTPISAGSHNARVDSVTPTLTWTPSSQPGVTYDVLIYEAVQYARNPLGVVKDSVQGAQVQYEQGITSPMLKVSPLRPNTTYFWSVRLRRGEIVSNWSTFSYFNFYLIATTRGRGQWFSFSTPGN